MYKVSFHKKAYKDLESFPLVQREIFVHFIETKIVMKPLRAGKPLRGILKLYFAFRVGNYRIVYKIEKEMVLILSIGHRKNVYMLSEKRV
jgi:mRNA interferase RelE/StbE